MDQLPSSPTAAIYLKTEKEKKEIVISIYKKKKSIIYIPMANRECSPISLNRTALGSVGGWLYTPKTSVYNPH